MHVNADAGHDLLDVRDAESRKLVILDEEHQQVDAAFIAQRLCIRRQRSVVTPEDTVRLLPRQKRHAESPVERMIDPADPKRIVLARLRRHTGCPSRITHVRDPSYGFPQGRSRPWVRITEAGRAPAAGLRGLRCQQILRTACRSAHADQVVDGGDEDAMAEQLESIGRASKVVVALRARGRCQDVDPAKVRREPEGIALGEPARVEAGREARIGTAQTGVHFGQSRGEPFEIV